MCFGIEMMSALILYNFKVIKVSLKFQKCLKWFHIYALIFLIEASIHQFEFLSGIICIFVRATNLCLRGNRVKWRSGHGMDDRAGLPHFPLCINLTTILFYFILFILYVCMYVCMYYLQFVSYGNVMRGFEKGKLHP